MISVMYNVMHYYKYNHIMNFQIETINYIVD